MNDVEKKDILRYLNNNIYPYLGEMISWNYKVLNVWDEFPTLIDTIISLRDIHKQNVLLYYLKYKLFENKKYLKLESYLNNYYNQLLNNDFNKDDLLNSEIEIIHLYNFCKNKYRNDIIPPLNDEVLSNLDLETEEINFFNIKNDYILELYYISYLKGKKICSSTIYHPNKDDVLTLKRNVSKISKINK